MTPFSHRPTQEELCEIKVRQSIKKAKDFSLRVNHFKNDLSRFKKKDRDNILKELHSFMLEDFNTYKNYALKGKTGRESSLITKTLYGLLEHITSK